MNGDLTDKYPMTPPAVVAWLGYGGILPFVFLTLAGLLDRDHGPLWSDALNAYGAIILSFLGALHWACLLYTSPSPRDRTRSRMPSSA